jgi:two-component system NarL family sensor kinase
MGNMENNLQENTFVFLMVIGILIMLALALAFVIFFNFSQKKILTEQMRNQKLAYEHQEELLHSTILTQEEERKRIARELHDDIGSKLNVILLNIHRLKKFSNENKEMEAIASEINSVIHTTIETTRRISHDLLPPTLEEFGLVEAIKELRDTFHQTFSISIDFDLMENEKQIEDKLIELNIFRVLQELINNSIRHGKAKEIKIGLWLKSTAIKLEYLDDGEGFDLNNLEIKRGLGMKNIESRLNMIQATFKYDSAPGKGMKMFIEV